MLKFNVSVSPIASQNIYTAWNNVSSMISVGNDDIGEDGAENNIVMITDGIDDSGSIVTEKNNQFMLPADSWKDIPMLEWILALKTKNEEASELDSLFTEVVTQQFMTKVQSGGFNKLETFKFTGAGDQKLGNVIIDRQIDSNQAIVDENLATMKEVIGELKLQSMSNQEFYKTYKSFVADPANF